MWFNPIDIKKHHTKYIDNLHGYVLPHAGTKFTGNILSHTLRFKPIKKNFKYILIIYYPANDKPNVGKYYHEFFVIYNTMKLFFKNKKYKYIGYNIRSQTKPDISYLNKTNTLYVISADFSHFLPFQKALKQENCAAQSMMHRKFNLSCNDVIDHMDSFKFLYTLIPNEWSLQWIGRTRSPGKKGVGYLSFLLRDSPKINKHIPDGFFVTAYDLNMNHRESLGKYYWNETAENNLISDVINKAKTTSRLTNGQFLNIPITNYTITYLYKDTTRKFIRGWHAIKKGALYLPNVFLENTYDNGKWIDNNDNKWKKGNKFRLRHTFKKLNIKNHRYNKTRKKKEKYTLYYSEVLHKTIK